MSFRNSDDFHCQMGRAFVEAARDAGCSEQDMLEFLEKMNAGAGTDKRSRIVVTLVKKLAVTESTVPATKPS